MLGSVTSKIKHLSTLYRPKIRQKHFLLAYRGQHSFSDMNSQLKINEANNLLQDEFVQCT